MPARMDDKKGNKKHEESRGFGEGGGSFFLIIGGKVLLLQVVLKARAYFFSYPSCSSQVLFHRSRSGETQQGTPDRGAVTT